MEKEFREIVRSYLEMLNEDLEEVLKKLINYQFPEEVKSLDFEIFSDGFTEGFPVRAFFMDIDNTEFFVYRDGKAEYPSPVDPGLLNINNVFPSEIEEIYEEKDEDFNSWGIATEELTEWFAIRWIDAGGGKFNLKASIAHHDSLRKYDLVQQKWIEE